MNMYRNLAIVYAIIIFAASSIPGHYILGTTFFAWDKLIHVIEFWIFGLLVGLALIKSKNTGYSAKWLAFTARFGLFYSLFDEAHQWFVPGRYASWRDVVADLMGIFLALVALSLLYERIKPEEEAVKADA